MNIKQLELKRLRELLGAIRRGRHMAQAMRTPMARLVRFDRETANGINRVLAKWETLGLKEPIGTVDRTFDSDSIDHLKVHTAELTQIEKKVVGRIAKLEKDPLLRAPASEVKAARKRRTAAQQRITAKLKAALDKRMAVVDQQAAADFARLEADAEKRPRPAPGPWAMNLAAVKRAYAARNWGQYNEGLRAVAAMSYPLDLEILSTIVARARNVQEGGKP